jgi:predicted metalloenzyme YecM
MISNYAAFLDELFARLVKTGVDVKDLELDHIAYKTSSEEEYYNLLPEFKKMGNLIKENIVRERRVGHFKLFQSIIYKQYTIPAFEVIAPKVGEVIKSDWEHAEFLLTESFQNFMDHYPNLNWDTSVMNSAEFPMIKLKLGDDMQVKFPLNRLLDAIEKEKS